MAKQKRNINQLHLFLALINSILIPTFAGFGVFWFSVLFNPVSVMYSIIIGLIVSSGSAVVFSAFLFENIYLKIKNDKDS